MTITEAYALYEQQILLNKTEKTKENHRCAIKSFMRTAGDLPVQLITKHVFARWEWEMTQRGNSGTNMRDYMLKLTRVIRFLRDEGVDVMSVNGIEYPKNDTKESEWLLPEEMKQMFDACKDHRERALLATYWAVGGRPSEVLNLDRSDLEKEMITICGKNNVYRDITIDAWTRGLIDAYLDTRKDNFPPLFLSAQRRRLGLQRTEEIIHEISWRAGIEKNITPYTLRHSFVSDMLNRQAPVKEVSQLVGHKRTSTTMNTYHHALPSNKWRVKEKYHTQIA